MLSITIIAIVAAAAFGSYLAVQTATENNVREALLQQQMERQIDNVDALSERITADIELISLRMQLLTEQDEIKSGQFRSDSATALLKQEYEQLNRITFVEGLSVLDQNNIIANTAVDDQRQFVGSDLSQREYVTEVRQSLQPYLSTSHTSLSGKLAFAIAVPIIDHETGQQEGTLVARFILPEFFERYQDDHQISRIVAFDRNQAYISSTIPEFLGEEYWGETVQSATSANPQLNAAYTTLFSGKPASTLFISGVTLDERFVSGSPVFYRGEQVMSVVITTPTAAIYSQVDDILLAQRIQVIATLVAVVTVISILIFYLSKWNRTLDAKVKQRTIELEKANDNLEIANQRLEKHDKLQKEFVNIAAHELRTPIQPMLGITELIKGRLDGRDRVEVSRDDVELLERNAQRLERLSSQLLEVARIEGGSVKLNLEPVDISTKIKNVIADAQRASQKDIDIHYNEPEKPLIVHADRIRLFEVLSNLLRNAIKFTEHGSITISARPSEDGNEVIIKISDTGSGIDPEVMPRLFTKFATKSDSGTGIGLYLAKNFVEAHGGRIWAENNPDGRGATFSFSLPIMAEQGRLSPDLRQ